VCLYLHRRKYAPNNNQITFNRKCASFRIIPSILDGLKMAKFLEKDSSADTCKE